LRRAWAAPLLLAALVSGCGQTPEAAPVAAADPADKAPAAAPQAPAAAPQAPAEKAAWPLFRGDAQATGVAKSTLPEKPALLWKFTVEKGAFEGTAAIVDGVAYIGDLDGTLYALDLSTGEKKWEFKTEAGFNTSPAVRDGLVYIGDIDGKFYCLTKDGQPKWGHEAGAEINSSANFYKEFVLVGSQDATLYCLHGQTGELKWKFEIQDQIRCSPTVVEDRAFVAGCDSKLHVIDLEKGAAVAGVPIEAPTGVTPAVLGEYAYFGTEGGAFFAVNWKDAKIAWTFTPERGTQPFRSSPAVTDACVVFGGRNKQVQALDPKTGEELWTFAARNRVDSSPVIVGKRAFIGSADGRLYALDLKTGKEVWQYEAGGGFAGSPAVAENRLVIASEDGVVYCFGEK
jgi:outer membrane protein assembly factor BamB